MIEDGRLWMPVYSPIGETYGAQDSAEDSEGFGFLKKEIGEIKEHMVDVDSILTEDDYKALLKHRREKGEGSLASHDKLKQELGL